MRSEFSHAIRKEALKRSGMLCEAVGEAYGLPPGQRCNAKLSYGVDFDHILPDALGGEATLDNCAAVCRRCHDFKTAKGDVPRIAKADAIKARHLGVKKSSRPIPGSKASPFKRRMDGTVVLRRPKQAHTYPSAQTAEWEPKFP